MLHSSASTICVSRCGSPRGDPGSTIVWVGGDQDAATKVPLAVAIARAALDDVPVLVDLSEVTFMDASTVGAILGGRNRLVARGQSVELRSPSAPALRVLELGGLTELIHGHAAHLAEASAALRTWVDVPPIDPRERTDHEAATRRVYPPARWPADDPAVAGVVRAVGAGRARP